jgi:hypothetical protein
MSAFTATPAAAQSVYVAGSGGRFGILDASNPNPATNYTRLGITSVTLNGIASASSTLLYGLRDDGLTLGTVNTSNGAFTALGSLTGLGTSTLFNLAFINGDLYGIDDSISTRLYRINTTTLTATLVGSGFGTSVDGGIAQGPGASAYGINSTSPNPFFSINTTAGTATQISASTGFAASTFALAYTGGVMYGISASSGNIRTINLATGAGTAAGSVNTASAAAGTVFSIAPVIAAAAVPEPGTVGLLGAAGLPLLGVVAARRRKTA